MSNYSFHSRKSELLKFCKTEQNIEFLETLYLIFHQIFLYRLTDIVLDISQYEYLKPEKIDSFEESYQMTLYTSYRNIIHSTLSDSILEKYFVLFNSYEKCLLHLLLRLQKKRFQNLMHWNFGNFSTSKNLQKNIVLI